MSRVTLFTNTDVVAPQELVLPAEVQVYYINEDDGAVYRRGLSESAGQKVFELRSVDSNDRVVASKEANGGWSISAWTRTMDARDGKLVPILTSQTLTAAAMWRSDDAASGHVQMTSRNFGKAAELGSPGGGQWAYFAGSHFAAWLQATRSDTGEQFVLEWETPFGFWTVRNLVQLPNGMALFQLGWDQICVFDAATRRVALLWHGRGPLPVIAAGEGAAKK